MTIVYRFTYAIGLWMEVVFQLFQMTRHNLKRGKLSYNSVAHTSNTLLLLLLLSSIISEHNMQLFDNGILNGWIFQKLLDHEVNIYTFGWRHNNRLTFIRVSIAYGYQEKRMPSHQNWFSFPLYTIGHVIYFPGYGLRLL